MSFTPEQEARARQDAHEMLEPVGFHLTVDRDAAVGIVTRALLAEREKLDAANARADGARAAALREAAKLCRERAAYYGAPMPLSARTVVEKTAEACCLDLVDAIEALAANPQTTEEGPCELK